MKWIGIIILVTSTRYRWCRMNLWDNVSEYTLFPDHDLKKSLVFIALNSCGVVIGGVIKMFTVNRACHMPSIAGRFSDTFLITLIITSLQTLFLCIFYVNISPYKSGMNWGGSGLILAPHNLWPWIKILSMYVKFKIFVVLVPETCFD